MRFRVSVAILLALSISTLGGSQGQTQKKPLSASVSLKSGATYEVLNIFFLKGTWSGPIYFIYDDYEISNFPLDEIKSIVFK